MHDAVDGGQRRHGVLEDACPLREDQVCRQGHAPMLVAFGEQGEQDLHLIAVMLNVADVVEHETVEAVELRQELRQAQVTLGSQEPLDKARRRSPIDRVPLEHEFVAKGGDEMALAHSRFAHGDDVDRLCQEGPRPQPFNLLADRQREAVNSEGAEGLCRVLGAEGYLDPEGLCAGVHSPNPARRQDCVSII